MYRILFIISFIMHIIIPLSGIGKRFIDAGYADPKPLIVVENKPIIEHVVNLFPGETKFTFICNNRHLAETNMKQILLRIVPTANIFEEDVNNRRGPVDAVMQAKECILDEEEVIVSYCDYGTQWDYIDFKEKLHSTSADGGIACYKGFHPHMLGNDNYAFVKETDMWMEKIQEKKPFTDNKMNEYASNGTYYFKSGSIVKKYFQKLMDMNIHVNGEYYVSMVYNLMREDSLNILIFPIKKMLQWGTPKDLEEYLVWSNYFLKRDPHFNTGYCDKFNPLVSEKPASGLLVSQNVPSATQRVNTVLILPMAGAGSRFFTEGYSIPKPLLDIEGLPMVIQAVNCLPPTSHKIFICQNEHLNKYDIENTIHKHFNPLVSEKPISGLFVSQNVPFELQMVNNLAIIGINHITEGQACTCEIAIDKYNISDDTPILISACDNGVYYDINKYNALVNDDTVDMVIWCFSNNPTSKLYPHMYAWLDVDEFDNIKRVSIKKPFDDCENKYAIIGTMLFKKTRIFKEGLELVYKNNIRTNGEYYVDNLIEPLIQKGYRAKIFNVTNYLCWGTPNDYKTYNYWQEYFIR